MQRETGRLFVALRDTYVEEYMTKAEYVLQEYVNTEMSVYGKKGEEPPVFVLKKKEKGLILLGLTEDAVSLEGHTGFVEVTHNPIYMPKLQESKLKNGVILEGGDLVGKTTLANALIQEGYICQDREVDHICPYMLGHIAEETRVVMLSTWIPMADRKVLFLIHTDELELQKRYKARKELGQVSMYDEEAYYYSQMYHKTGGTLLKNGVPNFDMLIADGKSVENLVSEVKRMLEGICE